MKESTFNEECPHCGESQDVRSKWESKDYDDNFTFECSDCGRTIEVVVHHIPEFESMKAKCPFCKKQETDGGYCRLCLTNLQAINGAAK